MGRNSCKLSTILDSRKRGNIFKCIIWVSLIEGTMNLCKEKLEKTCM